MYSGTELFADPP